VNKELVIAIDDSLMSAKTDTGPTVYQPLLWLRFRTGLTGDV